MLLVSSVGQTGDQVALLSPMLHLDRPTILHFYFHMWLSATDTTASLKIYKNSMLHTYEQILFETTGNHGNEWYPASVCLPAGRYNIAFVGTVGINYVSDIGLDSVGMGSNCTYLESATISG